MTTQMMGRQSQKSGDNSQQIQVHGDLHQGLTLEEATKVADLVARQVFAEHFAEGDQVGMQRIERMNDLIIERLNRLDKLGAFRDPAFQVSFRKAQIGAASTEREDDYDLLASLLEDRALRGEDRQVRAGLNLAIQIVDQLDDAALAGLTMLVALTTYTPKTGHVVQGLQVMEQLLSQFPIADLPSGADWLDHLDLLGGVRLSALGSMPPYEQLFGNAVPGYVAIGLEESSADLASITEDLANRGAVLPISPHELKPGYLRLAFSNLKEFEAWLSLRTQEESRRSMSLQLANDRLNFDKVDGTLYEPLGEQMDTFPTLRAVRAWWNAIPTAMSSTGVGRLLARANADRLDTAKLLPPL